MYVCLLQMAACTRVVPEDCGRSVPVTFAVSENVTKSSFRGLDDEIRHLSVFLYRDGCLETVVESDGGPVSASLCMGVRYDAFALANSSGFVPPAGENDLRDMMVDIPSLEEMVDGLPMCWERTGFLSGMEGVVEMEFDRLFAELSFSVDPSLLPGLEVKSVRVCNACASVSPFCLSGSRAVASESVSDGDYATESDIAAVNDGGVLTLYVPENRQGVLLPGNTDPEARVPDMLDAPELCTYLEVECRFSHASALEGNVVYRLYPGLDGCTDFSIVRNCCYGLALCPTPGGLDEVSWRVSTDAGFREGQASAEIETGLHSLDDMYAGEVSKLRLSLAPALESTLGENLTDCSLCLFDSEGNPSACVSTGPLYREGGILFCDIHAAAPTDPGLGYSYRLLAGGRSVSVDGQVRVRKPYLVTGGMAQKLVPVVNGDEVSFDVFVVDAQGRNLNGRGAYGFDPGVFGDLSAGCRLNPSFDRGDGMLNREICSCHELRRISAGDGGTLSTYRVQLVNPGFSDPVNRELSRLFGQDVRPGEGIWYYDISSENAEPASVPVGMDIPPVRLWYFGRNTVYGTLAVRTYGSAPNDAYLALSNPSHLCLHAGVWTTGCGTFGASAFPGVSTSTFLTSDKSCADVLAVSRTGFMTSPVGSREFYLSAIDGTEAECYPLEVNSDGAFRSFEGMRETVEEGGEILYFAQADAFLSTVSGLPVQYVARDIYAEGVADAFLVRGFAGLSAWSPGDVIVEKRNSSVAFMGDYRLSWVDSVLDDVPVSVTVYWDPAEGLCLRMEGNSFGTSFGVAVTAAYRSTCEWQQNNNDSRHREYYGITMPYAPSVRFSGSSSTQTLIPRLELEQMFSALNRNYWHECSTNLVNLPGNRFARLSLPVSVDFTVKLVPEDRRWTPCQVSVSEPCSDELVNVIYSSTSRGTYPVNGIAVNPDSSSRGTHDSASSVAAQFNDYVRVPSCSFDVSVSVEGLHAMHRM